MVVCRPRNSSNTATRARPGSTRETTACNPRMAPSTISTASPGFSVAAITCNSSCAEGLFQLLDDRILHHRPARPKMHHAADPGRRLDLAQGSVPVEPREEIIGKQRLGGPDQPLPGGALEADARQQHLDPLHFPQVRGGDVFVLGPGQQAEPVCDGRHGVNSSTRGSRFQPNDRCPLSRSVARGRRWWFERVWDRPWRRSAAGWDNSRSKWRALGGAEGRSMNPQAPGFACGLSRRAGKPGSTAGRDACRYLSQGATVSPAQISGVACRRRATATRLPWISISAGNGRVL